MTVPRWDEPVFIDFSSATGSMVHRQQPKQPK
jgi:hypothetical protein